MKQTILTFAVLICANSAAQAEFREPAGHSLERYYQAQYQPAPQYTAVDPFAQSSEAEIYEFQPSFAAVIRGQSPQTYDLGPQGSPYFGGSPQPGMMQPGMSDPGMYQPGMQQPGMMQGGGMIQGSPYGGAPMQPGYDPFQSSPYGGMPGGAFPGGQVFDINGPQPVKLGWSTRWDFEYIFPADLAQGGEVSTYAIDWASDYVQQAPNGWLWSMGPEFGYRMYNFDGAGNPWLQPTGVGDPGVSDNYYHLGYRFEATSPPTGPLSYRLGFTPSINTDFQKQLNSQAWNFDVDATMFYRASPTWMWVVGVKYWDRAEDFIIPHVGAVWNPNQFWEIRAVYPNPRVDYFIGTPFGIATWLYAGAEYSVESYHAGEIAQTKAQLQVEEWKAFAGIRWEGCRLSSYLDFGYAFDRKWNIHSAAGTSDLAPDDAFMIRYGVRY